MFHSIVNETAFKAFIMDHDSLMNCNKKMFQWMWKHSMTVRQLFCFQPILFCYRTFGTEFWPFSISLRNKFTLEPIVNFISAF